MYSYPIKVVISFHLHLNISNLRNFVDFSILSMLEIVHNIFYYLIHHAIRFELQQQALDMQ